METTTLRFALVLSLLFPAAVRLGAQDAARGPGAEKLEKMLRKFPESDANKEGKLTAEEAKAFRQKYESKQQARADAPKGAGTERLAPTHADVACGEDPKQVFDIWLAKPEDGKQTPLCLFPSFPNSVWERACLRNSVARWDEPPRNGVLSARAFPNKMPFSSVPSYSSSYSFLDRHAVDGVVDFVVHVRSTIVRG